MLAGAGITITARTAAGSGREETKQRVYGLEQPAKTPRDTAGIPDTQFTADLQACAEFCYIFQCNGCAPGAHLYRCTSRSRGDYFVCASGVCGAHCRHPLV
jgi:hypothetical protein